MSTNEEYLDSLLKDFEKSINSESEEEILEEEVVEEAVEEAVEVESVEEAVDAEQEFDEPIESLNETEIEHSEENLNITLDEIKNMDVDEDVFFSEGTQDFDKLDSLFVDSMKLEWESGLDVEEFGFSEEDFQITEEDLKFDFEEEQPKELESVELDENVTEQEETAEDEPWLEMIEEIPEEVSVQMLSGEPDEEESLEEAVESVTSEGQEIADIFELLEGAEAASQEDSERISSENNLDIDFSNIFDTSESSLETGELNLEYEENDVENQQEEAEEKRAKKQGLFQRLMVEKEDPEEEEKLRKKQEEKAAKKAEKAERKEEKKRQRLEISQAKKEAKRVKKEAESEEAESEKAGQPYSGKSIGLVILFGITIGVCVVVLSSILSYYPYVTNARKYFDAREYEKAYEELEGIKIKDKDLSFYTQVRTMEKLSKNVSSYERMWLIDHKEEALSSLIEGVAVYDEKAEYAESIGLANEYQLVLDEIVTVLEKEFQISLKEARTKATIIGTGEYSDWIREQVKEK